jgi:hypothetical protein
MKYYLNLFLIFILFESCTSQSALNYNELDLKWKKDVMLQLSSQFIDYIKVRPRNAEHNYELDMYNKFLDIDRYPFGKEIMKLKGHIESRNIVFDSIICLSSQTGVKLEPEALDSNCYYLFGNGKLVKLFMFDLEELKISEYEGTLEYQEFYSKELSKTDGNDNSLLIFTKIKPNWEFEIKKIVINSY